MATKTTAAAVPAPAYKPNEETVRQATALVAQAKALQVTNPAEYTLAADVLQNMRTAYKELDGQRKGITDKMRAAIESVTGLFRPKLTEIEEAGEIVKKKLLSFDEAERKRVEAEQRRVEEIARKEREKALAESRRVQEEADRKAKAERDEAERQRAAAAKAEADAKAAREQAAAEQRKADEAKRRGDAEAVKAAEQRKAEAERIAREESQRQQAALKSADKLEDKATAIESKADEKSGALLNVAATTLAPVIDNTPVKVAGNSRRKTWKYRIKDPAKIARLFLVPDESKIAKQVKALGLEAHALIGEGALEIYEDYDIAVGAKK